MTGKTSSSTQSDRERKHEKEFGGTAGAALMIMGLPIAICAINLTCNKSTCSVLSIPELPGLRELFSIEACLVYVCWFILQLILSLIPWGTLASGLPLKSTGHALKYRCNGFRSLVVTLILFLVLYSYDVPLTYVYDHYLQLMFASILFSLSLSLYLYTRSLNKPVTELAAGGQTGSIVYDFFIGRELNPRLGPVDFKFFCELRPGLIGWVVLDLCFILESVRQGGGGSGGGVASGLVLVSFFHALYVADALYHEEAILTTMDIVHDGFGLMLALGDLAWVPFLYSLQARFILEHPHQHSTAELCAISLINLVGYIIFRKSNSQKNEFRQNRNSPSVKHLRTLKTDSGSELIVSGLWGVCRHPNYLGDLLMALSWSLLTGYAHILPYFYPIYFLALLIHRSLRDERNCRNKYGRDWDKYCQLVPYRIFPYIY